ncbi:MAG: hypothetical protein HY747_10325 [Elusimicrobia bacterium]|nr:hypothetical protein [Elusimicrobiota bacterium]
MDAAICKEVLKMDYLQATSKKSVSFGTSEIKKVKSHHTKAKADIGLTQVIADLTTKGHVPCIPLSEHQPYDIVVIEAQGRVSKLQVKYATLKKNGTVEVRFRRSWADRNGSHVKAYSKEEFDYYAIFCPQRNTVLYVPNSDNCPKVIRFTKSANCQKRNVHWFQNYLDFKGESSETIRCTPEMVKT